MYAHHSVRNRVHVMYTSYIYVHFPCEKCMVVNFASHIVMHENPLAMFMSCGHQEHFNPNYEQTLGEHYKDAIVL